MSTDFWVTYQLLQTSLCFSLTHQAQLTLKTTVPLLHITCHTYVAAPLCWWLSFPSHQNRLVENRKGFGMEEFWLWIEAPPFTAVWSGVRSWVSSSASFVSSVELIDDRTCRTGVLQDKMMHCWESPLL